MRDHSGSDTNGREPLEFLEVPERVTMPLLTMITQQAMDEDYLHVAERRAEGAPRPLRGRPHRTAAVVIAVFGIMVTTAAVQTSRNADINDASRSTLISRVISQRESVSSQQDKIVRFRERNVNLENTLAQITTTEQSAVSRLRRLQVVTGTIPVTGEGVRITVDDPPQGDESQDVRDEDLALLVNGLWSAGAEAIAINGVRLTALSYIRNSGPAIHINLQPLSAPYTVLAIGDTRTLLANLLDTTSGQLFFQISDDLEFVLTRQNEDTLSLPAANLRRLRSVVAGTSDDPGQRQTEGATP